MFSKMNTKIVLSLLVFAFAITCTVADNVESVEIAQQDPEEVTERIYFNMTIDGQYIGRIVFGLFGNTVPLTVANFATICKEGINGIRKEMM